MQMSKTTILMAMFATALMATTASAAQDHGARIAGRGAMHGSGAAHFNAGAARINNSARVNSSAAAPRITAASSGVRTNFTGGARTAQFSGNRSTSDWRERAYRRGNFGGGFGAGLAAGALIGGATYAYGGYPYGYSDYGYAGGYDDFASDDGYGAYAGAPVGYGAYAQAPEANDEVYCEQRFQSYDPASGTYLGYDGLRHPCP